MSARRPPPRPHGVVLMLLMSTVAAAGLVVMVALAPSAKVPAQELIETSTGRLTAWADLAETHWRDTGSFPATSTALVALGQGVLPARNAFDPHDPDAGFRMTLLAGGRTLRLTGAGPDGRQGTADDLHVDVDATHAARAKAIARLRVLRAAFLRSPFSGKGLLTPIDHGRFRADVHAWARQARGLVWHSGPARRTALGLLATLERQLHLRLRGVGAPAIPLRASGPGGLLSLLGLPDRLAVDPWGHTLQTGPMGFFSVGPDGRGGTDDDL